MAPTDPLNAGGVGQVRTERVRLFDADNPLRLSSGATLAEVDIAYETYGTLNADASNAVFICHALTGDAHAAGVHEGATKPGWWDNLIGPGRPVDTDHFFVICPNLLGGCQGSTGPASVNPETGRAYGLDFPLLQMSDFVAVHRALLTHLGVQTLTAVVGGSLGGMQVLQWALAHPEQVRNAVIIAASSRLSAQNIAFSAVAREAIMRDTGFRAGHYLDEGTLPEVGLSIARMMAHITYLSEEAMAEKFGRRFQDSTTPRHGFGVDFEVESYLNHQGETFLNRFDALSYLYLTRVMDYFDPFSEYAELGHVRAAGTRFCVLSFDSDWRFDTTHSRRIATRLEQSGCATTFREISSPWGHDSFLLEIPAYHATVRAFLERAREEAPR
ncbi:homoserine O-acetyltransferase [Naumannella sp. ID2617S]|nr:homoserine O-acetyltransferase [Naumannella sp. ID2617S]